MFPKKIGREGKTVVSNFSYLLLVQVAGYVFPLFTLPYLARTIGVDGFGNIAFAMAIITYLQTITDWGFNLTATRDLARNRTDITAVERIYTSVTWCRILLMLLSFLLLLVLIYTVPKLHSNSAIILLTFLLIPGHILYPEWFFQAMENMRFIAIFNFIIKLIFTAGVFIFIRTSSDYLYYPIISAAGFIVSGIGATIYIQRRWKIKIGLCSFSEVIQTLKKSYNVFINTIFPNLYNSWSVLLLGFWGGASANGIYDGGNKFNTICYNFLITLSRAFFPFLARKPQGHELYKKINLGLAALMALILFFGAPLITKIFLGPQFHDSIIVLRIMSFSLIFLALSNTYGTNYLILKNKDKLLRNITITSSIIGFCCSIPLVYYLSYIGAALTICLTRGILGCTVYFFARKISSVQVS